VPATASRLGLACVADCRSVHCGSLEFVGVELDAINGTERRAAAKGWPEHASREDAATACHWDGTGAWESTVLRNATELGALVRTKGVWHFAVAVAATERSKAATLAEHWELGFIAQASLGVWHTIVVIRWLRKAGSVEWWVVNANRLAAAKVWVDDASRQKCARGWDGVGRHVGAAEHILSNATDRREVGFAESGWSDAVIIQAEGTEAHAPVLLVEMHLIGNNLAHFCW